MIGIGSNWPRRTPAVSPSAASAPIVLVASDRHQILHHNK
jgi:hypothetical protein